MDVFRRNSSNLPTHNPSSQPNQITQLLTHCRVVSTVNHTVGVDACHAQTSTAKGWDATQLHGFLYYSCRTSEPANDLLKFPLATCWKWVALTVKMHQNTVDSQSQHSCYIPVYAADHSLCCEGSCA